MKTYTFPYGTCEWDGTIDVELTEEEAALLELYMKKEDHFHLEDYPELKDIDLKVSGLVFEQTKEQMIADGRMEELQEDDPDADVDELVDGELGNFYVCFPNAFD